MKSVLISGCSSGIGLATARTLRDRGGYRVFASARQTAAVQRLIEVEGLADALRLDLDDSASIQQGVEEVLRKSNGQLFGLFNNAGFGVTGAVEDLSREALQAQFETNLFGTHELTRAILPAMRRQGEGRIIQNSSVLGLVAMPYRGAYIASKFALEGWSDALRLELQGSGIYVSIIEPGPILTRFRENARVAFERYIDIDQSPHRELYQRWREKLNQKGAANPFTLGPEAVVKRVIHALESRRPQRRYCVTLPTYLLTYLRRLLPTALMDPIARRL